MSWKVVATTCKWLDINVFDHVLEEINAKELKTMYDQNTSTNKAFMINKLVNLKHRDKASIAEHLKNFKNLVN